MGMCKTEGIAGPLDERLVAHQCLRSRRRCAIIIHYVSTRVLLTDYKLYSKAITSNMLGILHLTFSRPFIDDPICSRNLANCFSVNNGLLLYTSKKIRSLYNLLRSSTFLSIPRILKTYFLLALSVNEKYTMEPLFPVGYI
jgi:hypothetical protein